MATQLYNRDQVNALISEAVEMAAEHSERGELIDTGEVAELFGVKVTTVHQWRRRGVMLGPARLFSGMPAWDRSAVLRWAVETKRLP